MVRTICLTSRRKFVVENFHCSNFIIGSTGFYPSFVDSVAAQCTTFFSCRFSDFFKIILNLVLALNAIFIWSLLSMFADFNVFYLGFESEVEIRILERKHFV